MHASCSPFTKFISLRDRSVLHCSTRLVEVMLSMFLMVIIMFLIVTQDKKSRLYIYKRISSVLLCSPSSLLNTTTQVVQTTTRNHSNTSSKPLGQTLHIEVKPIHPICCILAASQCFPETELQPLFYSDCFLHFTIRRSAAIPASLMMPQRRAEASGTTAIIRRQLERALSPSPAAPC